MGQTFRFELSVKSCFLFSLEFACFFFLDVCLKVCSSISFLTCNSFCLNFGFQSSASLGCYFFCLFGSQLLLYPKIVSILCSNMGLGLSTFFKSRSPKRCSLSCLLGLSTRSPQNLIFKEFFGIDFRFDARSQDCLCCSATGGKLGFDSGSSESIFSLKSGDISGYEELYL